MKKIASILLVNVKNAKISGVLKFPLYFCG
jgi:hypothetical protein